MAYPLDMKRRAHELYIASGHIPTVYRTLKLEYKNHDLPKEITVRKWIEQNDLPEIHKSLNVDVIVQARTNEVSKRVQRQEEHQENYRKLQEKAEHQLFGDDPLKFHTAMEAAKAMDIGVQGERKSMKEQVNIRLVEDLLSSVFQIIRDEDIRRDIGIEFRKILQDHSDEY